MKTPDVNNHNIVPFPAHNKEKTSESVELVNTTRGTKCEPIDMAATLRALRKARGLKQPELAAMLGITKNAVTNWELGLSRPQTGFIPQLCEIFQCTANELFGMPEEHRLTDKELKHLRLYRAATPYEQHCVDGLLEVMMESREENLRLECKNKFMPVDIIDLEASAGTGNYLDEWEPDKDAMYLRICRDVCRADAVVTVSGDSMMPTFMNGEQILIQRTDSIEPGQIGIFVVNGDAYVKEYQKDGLHSHNPKYETIHPAKGDSVYCLGRVLSAVTDDMRPTIQEQKILDEINWEL